MDDSFHDRKSRLKVLLEHIKRDPNNVKEKITCSITVLKSKLVLLERIRWMSYTRPSINTLCRFYQLEDTSFLKIANLMFPSDGNIYKLPYEQTNSIISISISILDAVHKRVLVCSSELPNPIILVPDIGCAIKVNQRPTYIIDELSTDLVIFPKVPELPINRELKINEREKNNWLIALAAISYNVIWLCSKIWKRIVARCEWNCAVERMPTAGISQVVPMALFYFLRLLALLNSDTSGHSLTESEEGVIPAEAKNALLFLNSSGLLSSFSYLSNGTSLSLFYNSIESFWESHSNGN